MCECTAIEIVIISPTKEARPRFVFEGFSSNVITFIIITNFEINYSTIVEKIVQTSLNLNAL